jgi:hypothetical protein
MFRNQTQYSTYKDPQTNEPDTTDAVTGLNPCRRIFCPALFFNGIFLALGVASYQIAIDGFTVLSHLARKMGWPVLTDSQTRLLEQG